MARGVRRRVRLHRMGSVIGTIMLLGGGRAGHHDLMRHGMRNLTEQQTHHQQRDQNTALEDGMAHDGRVASLLHDRNRGGHATAAAPPWGPAAWRSIASLERAPQDAPGASRAA